MKTEVKNAPQGIARETRAYAIHTENKQKTSK
jgi:hypothetical protein